MLAVGAEGQVVEKPAVPLEGEDFLACLGIPHTQFGVHNCRRPPSWVTGCPSAGGTDKVLAIAAKGHAVDEWEIVPLHGEERVRVAQPLEVMPFEAAQVRLPWLGAMLFQ